MFIGSTDDAHTFVVINRRIPDADRMLAEAGFQAREHHGRTLYVLPPATAQSSHERAGAIMYGLLAHTHDLIDFSWTTLWSPDRPVSNPDLHFRFSDNTVSVTAKSATARSILEQHHFIPMADGASYRPPDKLSKRGLISAVTLTDGHAHAHGLDVRISLGIPTLADIPAAPHGQSSDIAAPPATPRPRRTR
ncbi:hypothetical protein CXR04_10050 [Streptomyces sp. CMB-StM0423]|nr:hypothetical protein CXR04_10050 [Streptomyces sp. CMB-StM0423]